MRDHDLRPDYVIFEFRRVGAFVKVSAVDPRTLTEVSIVGSRANKVTNMTDARYRNALGGLEHLAKYRFM